MCVSEQSGGACFQRAHACANEFSVVLALAPPQELVNH